MEKEKFTIEIPFYPTISLPKLKIFCKEYDCDIEPNREREGYFLITSEDPVNFFWLGSNLTLQRVQR